jgi:2-methylcitrate dehydratase PrpD
MLRSDPSLSNANIGAVVQAVSRAGKVYNASVPIPPGSMANPADDSSLMRKFLTLSESVLGRARAQQAIEVTLSLDTKPNLENLLTAITSSKQG